VLSSPSLGSLLRKVRYRSDFSYPERTFCTGRIMIGEEILCFSQQCDIFCGRDGGAKTELVVLFSHWRQRKHLSQSIVDHNSFSLCSNAQEDLALK
jgi:hypothetical protein